MFGAVCCRRSMLCHTLVNWNRQETWFTIFSPPRLFVQRVHFSIFVAFFADMISIRRFVRTTLKSKTGMPALHLSPRRTANLWCSQTREQIQMPELQDNLLTLFTCMLATGALEQKWRNTMLEETVEGIFQDFFRQRTTNAESYSIWSNAFLKPMLAIQKQNPIHTNFIGSKTVNACSTPSVSWNPHWSSPWACSRWCFEFWWKNCSWFPLGQPASNLKRGLQKKHVKTLLGNLVQGSNHGGKQGVLSLVLLTVGQC